MRKRKNQGGKRARSGKELVLLVMEKGVIALGIEGGGSLDRWGRKGIGDLTQVVRREVKEEAGTTNGKGKGMTLLNILEKKGKLKQQRRKK